MHIFPRHANFSCERTDVMRRGKYQAERFKARAGSGQNTSQSVMAFIAPEVDCPNRQPA
ncbi:MAG: hypothetical protein GDA35_04845 [Hyphomonadaceae bacterium]|nr:hypothetical protein [Hyphomonadaceae bacterium]